MIAGSTAVGGAAPRFGRLGTKKPAMPDVACRTAAMSVKFLPASCTACKRAKGDTRLDKGRRARAIEAPAHSWRHSATSFTPHPDTTLRPSQRAYGGRPGQRHVRGGTVNGAPRAFRLQIPADP